MSDMPSRSFWVRYGYTLVTLSLFGAALIGQWIFGWLTYVHDQQAHNQPVEVSSYFFQLARDTLENWQSEFLQLVWQVAGLAFLFHVGSPSSREGSARLEAKVDEILKRVSAEEGAEVIRRLDRRYQR